MAAVYAYPQPMTVFLKSAKPQGLNIPIVTGDGTRPDEQATRLGTRALAENFFSVYSFTAPFDDPKFDHYKELFTKDHASLGWDTVALEGAVSCRVQHRGAHRDEGRPHVGKLDQDGGDGHGTTPSRVVR